jgi:hypothetical protein
VLRGGHLDTLRYLVEQGCPHDGVAACSAAARMGHIDTLRYMRERNWPWDAVKACEMTAASGSVDIIKFIVEQDNLVFTAAQLTKMLNAAGASSAVETARWLREQGAQWPAVLVYNGHYGDGEHAMGSSWRDFTLKWARD